MSIKFANITIGIWLGVLLPTVLIWFGLLSSLSWWLVIVLYSFTIAFIGIACMIIYLLAAPARRLSQSVFGDSKAGQPPNM